METLLRDIRFGLRSLLKRPGITAIAVFTLAVGIGANTAIFSFVNGILLRPLPYPEPDRLALITETALKRGVPDMGISFPNFLDWRAQNSVFQDIATYQGSNFALTGAGEPEQLRGARIDISIGVPRRENDHNQQLVMVLEFQRMLTSCIFPEERFQRLIPVHAMEFTKEQLC